MLTWNFKIFQNECRDWVSKTKEYFYCFLDEHYPLKEILGLIEWSCGWYQVKRRMKNEQKQWQWQRQW